MPVPGATSDALLSPLLAHAGAGAGWQAIVALASAGLVVALILAAFDKVPLESAGDLVLPLAGVMIISTAAPVAGELLSDLVGWLLPAGVVALVAMVVAAVTPVGLRPTSGLFLGALGLAAVLVVTLGPGLSELLHPDEATTSGSGAAASRDRPEEQHADRDGEQDLVTSGVAEQR